MNTMSFSVAALVLLASCANNEQTGQLLGAGGFGAIGAALGKKIGHTTGAAAIGGGAGVAIGFVVGGAIGRSLDQRDQGRAALATQQALAQPASHFPPSPAAPAASYSSPSTSPRPVTNRPTARSKPVPWTSDHSGASGSATVVAAEATASGGECKTVHEIAYVGGQEVTQNTKYCRDAGSPWKEET